MSIRIELKKKYGKGIIEEFNLFTQSSKEDSYCILVPEENNKEKMFIEIQGALNPSTLNHNEPSNPMTKEEIETWLDDNEVAATARRNRYIAYPRISDQLDDIYHNGIDGWKATIKVTKDKYPKR